MLIVVGLIWYRIPSKVRAIERAAGKHCVVKMGKCAVRYLSIQCRTACLCNVANSCDLKSFYFSLAIFKSCLQDENMWELAQLASEALERLKALLPPP